MMESWKLGLTINGKRYDWKDLLAFSSQQIVSVINPWEKEIYRFIINWLSDQPEIIQYSSGTTGKPKEIRLPKVSMMQSAKNTCDYLNIREGDTALLCMPVDYIAGKMMLVRSMVCGLNLYIVEPKSMPEIEMLPVVDFAAMVPLQVLNLAICHKFNERIRVLLIGGAEVSIELENLMADTSTETYATYGMAESSSHIALRRLNKPEPQKEYHTVPGVEVGCDNRGCLIIEAQWLPGKIVTNDLIDLIDNHTFRWLGRFDNLINSGGIKIVPEEVERLIAQKTGRECVAVGIKDPKFGHKLVLVMEKGQFSGDPEILKNELNTILPRRWKCRDLLLVPKFPRNEALKIDRKSLIAML